uniref:Uncharacterized protein n=1 Tax=Anguilla anguilla TaxID=7936 RepID=A0A0E9Q8L8_ANGAN
MLAQILSWFHTANSMFNGNSREVKVVSVAFPHSGGISLML